MPGTSELVGRDREAQVVRELVQALAEGQGAVLLIHGEAGIGKTALVDRLATMASSRRVVVHRGEAHPFDRARPFGPVVDALGLVRSSQDPRRAAVGTLLAEGSGRADTRHRVVEEVLDILERTTRSGPVALLVEDLQWADTSTLLVLRAMAHRLAHAAFVLVLTMRPAPRRPELDQLIDDALHAGATLIELEPLQPVDIDALAALELHGRPPAELAPVLERTGGNPLWIVEIVRSLRADDRSPGVGDALRTGRVDVPDSFRALVLRRLADLPTESVEVLRIAAVLGDAFSVRDLAAVVGRPTATVIEQLAPAYDARVLRGDGETVAFRHQLVQDAVYQALPHPLRRALHREAAAVLASIGAPSSEVADHVVLGADRGDLEAVAWLREAARAASAGAPTIAVDLLRRAEALLPGGHPEADHVAVELVHALLQAGEVADAATRAEVVLDRAHDDDVDLPMRLALVSALSLQNRAADLIARAEGTLSARPGLPPAAQSLVLAQASYGRTFSGDVVGGEAAAVRALHSAEQGGDPGLTAWSLTTMSVAVKLQGRYEDALVLARRAAGLAAASPEARQRHPHFFLGMALADADELDDARAAFARAIDECDELSSSWLLPDILLMSAETRAIAGEWQDARSEVEAGLLLAEQHGQRVLATQSLALLDLLDLAQGCTTTRAVRPEERPAEDAWSYGGSFQAFVSALRTEGRGDPVAAHDLLSAASEADAERSIRHHVRLIAPALVRVAIERGARSEAERATRLAAAAVEAAPRVRSVRGALRRCEAMLHGDADAAMDARHLMQTCPRVIERAATLEDAARVLRDAGQTPAAVDCLLEALQVYEDVEATTWAARATASLRQLGVRRGSRGPRARAARGWSSLSATERSVSELVAEGLTNREVARHLHLSPHTVNTHLRHVFQKLAVTNRAALAAEVVRAQARGPGDEEHSNE